MKKQAGFTIIELLVAVAIIGILAAIALPGYTDYMLRGRIPEATSTLAIKRVKMEQFFQDNKTYVGAPDCNADSTSSKNFTFECSGAGAPSAAGYTLRATGLGGMAGFSYTIDQSNTKTTASVPAGWTVPSPNNCWVIKKGGVC